MKAHQLFQLPPSLQMFSQRLLPDLPPWEWLRLLGECLRGLALDNGGSHIPAGVQLSGDVYLHPTVKLPPYAVIEGPCYIGAHTEIRPNAYLRGNVIVGEHCVIGHSGEFKNCLLMDYVQAPHRPYVGDSILGNHTHLGAGVVLANLRIDQAPVRIHISGETYETKLRKLGAILGDHAEVGCNAVLQPGAVLGKRAVVAPAISFGGFLPESQIALSQSEHRARKA